jgi:hypothetical protein
MNGRPIFALLVLAFPFARAIADELPHIQLDAPLLNDEYANSSSISVVGQLSVPLSTNVYVRIYHVLDDGGLVPLGGASFGVDRNGQFGTTIFPASPGWRVGRARIEVQLGGLSQVRAERDIEISPAPNARGEWITRPTPSSGIKIDRDRGGLQSRTVPAGQRFLVRGTFPLRKQPGAVQGPPVLAEIQRVSEKGRRVNVQANRALSLPKDDDCHWYEIELTAPNEPGTYFLELRPILAEGAEQIEVEAITLVVAEPAS